MTLSGKWLSRLYLIAVIATLASIGAKTALTLKPYVNQPYRTLHKDVDWGFLNRGINRVHTFKDTGKWWTGTWCGIVPFWRPLTSYALWGERLLWPKEYMLPRQIVNVCLHLCFLGLAALLLWKLVRRPWMLLGGLWLFAGIRPHHINGPQVYILPVDDLLLDPKNITDTLVGIAIVLSLLLLLNRKWVASLIMAMISVGFKELGFMTWPLAAMMLGWINRDRISTGRLEYILASVKKNWLPILMWALAFCALAVVHLLAVGLGYQEGSNSLWYGRMAIYFGCPVLSDLLVYDRSQAIMAILLTAAIMACRRSSLIPRFLALLAAFTIAIWVDARIQGTPWSVSATRIIVMGEILPGALAGVAWLLIAWGARRDWQTIAFLWAMAFIASLPSWMAAQTWAHTRYLASLFMEAAVMAALIENARVIVNTYSGTWVLKLTG